MLDNGRFKLRCGHFSLHIQCIVTKICIFGKMNYACCPVADKEICRQDKIDGKRGVYHYWSEQEFHNFIKALLRNETLVDTFIRQQFLSPDTQNEEFKEWVSRLKRI